MTYTCVAQIAAGFRALGGSGLDNFNIAPLRARVAKGNIRAVTFIVGDIGGGTVTRQLLVVRPDRAWGSVVVARVRRLRGKRR
jgi:hypothetical protein